jgi:hypothetical protein
VNIIFAVTQSQLPLYRTLTELIDGAVVGELQQDSSNIVNLVAENYKVELDEIFRSIQMISIQKITSSVIMVSNDVPDGLTVKFTPDCQQ